MPKTPSIKLFHLVHSLSGSEKRYFKLFIKNKDTSHSKYAQLFDAIDAQEAFDDTMLQVIVYGGDPVETRKYSELKSYLYDLIVRSLQSYDEKSSIDLRLKGLLLGVRTLFKRSHFDDCKDLLRKAKKLATEYEDFNALIEILDWEKRIAYTQTDIAFLDQELGRIEKEETECLTQLKLISNYRSIFFKILVSLRKDVSRSTEQREMLKGIVQDMLLDEHEIPTSFKAKVLYFRSISLYYFSIAALEKFYQASLQLIQLLESNPVMMDEDVSEYISALNNHIISCGRLENYDEVDETLSKLRAVKPITVDDEVKVHRQYYMNKFRFCITTGEFKEGAKELTRHFKAIEKLDKRQFEKSNFYLQYFCIYFGVREYENALESLNEWLGNITSSVERKDIQSLARILNLIIHYELGNVLIMDSLVRSTQRYLTKENRYSELEKKFLYFVKESIKPKSKKETKKILETLKKDVEDLAGVSSIFNLFDVGAWLDSKITGKPFAEVVKLKFEQGLRMKRAI